MDIPALLRAEVEQQKQKIASLDRDGLVEWARSQIDAAGNLEILTPKLCIRWLLTEQPENVLATFTQTGQGYEALWKAARFLRSNGHDLPESVTTYLLDVALGVQPKPRRTTTIRTPSNQKTYVTGLRDSIIYRVVEKIVEAGGYRASANESTRNDNACAIVADALKVISEEYVTKVYWQKKREAAERADGPET